MEADLLNGVSWVKRSAPNRFRSVIHRSHLRE
jgi:hypothetical protein